MSDLPTPDPAPTPLPLFLDGWQALPVSAARVAMFGGALVALPVGVGLAIAATVLFPAGKTAFVAIFVTALVLAAIAGALLARARSRRTRWRLDARGLQVRRGLAFQSEVLVPRSRVQHLDIERGPIERRFGLATLVVHTAGTRLNALRQSGFVDADAVALRDALLPEAASGDDEL